MSKLGTSLTEKQVWGEDPIWKLSTFMLVRNLTHYNFPQKMDRGASSQVTPIVENALKSSKELGKALFISAEELEGIEKEFLIEHFFRLEGFRNRGENQRFVIDENGSFLGLLNMQDHLSLEVIDFAGKWDEAWKRLLELEKGLEKELEFAYSPRFGYLTADPGMCGTGLSVQVCLHVPALIYLEQLEGLVDEEVQAKGLEGTLKEPPGDLIILSNRYTIGKDRQEIAEGVKRCAQKIVDAEKDARDELRKKGDSALKDRISRAVGLLLHSYQIEVKEALGALSLVQLGIDLGIVKGVERSVVEESFRRCRRAHLLLSGETLEGEEIENKRATFLHRKLEGIEVDS